MGMGINASGFQYIPAPCCLLNFWSAHSPLTHLHMGFAFALSEDRRQLEVGYLLSRERELRGNVAVFSICKKGLCRKGWDGEVVEEGQEWKGEQQLWARKHDKHDKHELQWSAVQTTWMCKQKMKHNYTCMNKTVKMDIAELLTGQRFHWENR